MTPNKYFTYVVAYIESEHIDRVYTDLAKSKEYKEVEPYIPTVRVLKKQFKGEQTFEQVPLLLNYGFFKIPRYLAVSANFLENMKSNVRCIYSWVRDPAKMKVNPNELGEISKHRDYDDNHISIATATSEEIANLVIAARDCNIYSAEDIDSLELGNVVVLRGYPWEGLSAKVEEIDHKKRQVSVSLLLFNQQKNIKVSFDCIFFTLYHQGRYKDDLSGNASIEEMNAKNTLDKMTSKLRRNED